MSKPKSFALLLSFFIILVIAFELIYQGSKPILQDLISKDASSTSISPEVLGESTPSASLQKAYVTKAVDGDTIEVKIDNKLYKVRFIGINTPETVDPRRKVECFGKKASSETKRLVEGKEIFLEKDISEVDKYNRLLRYIYIPIEGDKVVFLNGYLVRTGFAEVSTYPPDTKYTEKFQEAQNHAQSHQLGLWSECQGN